MARASAATAVAPSSDSCPRHLASRLRLTALLAVPLAALSLASAVGTLLAPHLLVANPLLLIVLSPPRGYLAVAAATVPLPLFLAIGLLRLGAADPWHFLLGRTHGPTVARGLARGSPLAGRFARALLDVGHGRGLAIVALSPTGKVLMLAGATRLPPRRVALADAGGTLLQLVALHVAGGALAHALDPAERTLTVVAVVVALLAVAGPAAVAASVRRRSASGARNTLMTVPPAATFAS